MNCYVMTTLMGNRTLDNIIINLLEQIIHHVLHV